MTTERDALIAGLKFHPSASHVNPDFRDLFNKTLDQHADALAATAPNAGAPLADGEVISAHHDHATIRWTKPTGEPDNAWSWPVAGAKVYLAAPAQQARASDAQKAVNAIAALAPVLEDSAHGPRHRCQQCGYAWGAGLGTEGHAMNCAYAIATSVSHTPPAAQQAGAPLPLAPSEAVKSLLRAPLKSGERPLCYCPVGTCQAPKGFNGPCNRAPQQATLPASEADGKYDNVLRPFLALMERELHANSSKGDRPGWLTMTRDRALLEIYYHVSKLSVAMKNDDAPAIAEHAADVANMAMMALDVCGGIDTRAQPQADAAEPVAKARTPAMLESLDGVAAPDWPDDAQAPSAAKKEGQP